MPSSLILSEGEIYILREKQWEMLQAANIGRDQMNTEVRILALQVTTAF